MLFLHRLSRLGPLLLLVLLAHAARATHLLGGEMSYRYLDAAGPATAPLRYEITVTIYNNCLGTAGIAQPRAAANVAVYDQATGTRLTLTLANSASAQGGQLRIAQTSLSACTAPVIPPGCTITGVAQPYQLQRFVAVVNLPATTTGYYALFSDSARNIDVTNLDRPGNQALALYVALAPPQVPNHSPVFSDVAVAIICANDTTLLLNNAVDADGDRLVYSFGQPYGTAGGNAGGLPGSFGPPPVLVPYLAAGGYSATTPFGTGAGNLATIDPATGITRYASTQVGGKFAVAVDVSEYRFINGVEQLIGTTRRDLQLVVASCPPTKTPVLPPLATTPRNYTMEAGTTLTVPVTVTQADAHPLTFTLTSVLLDGAGGYQATLNGDPGTVAAGSATGAASVTGLSGTVTGTLVYTAGCADARATPYDLALAVQDLGCAGKTVFDVLHITVTKPRGPTAVTGDQVVCTVNTESTYAASGGTAPGLSWRVVGGTLLSSPTASPVRVRWTTPGTGLIVARGVTQYGCLTDSVVRRVAVAPAGTLAVTGKLTICEGSTTVAVAATATGLGSYTLVGGGSTRTGASPFVLSPTQTTTYTISATQAGTGCVASTQFTITVLPPPVAAVGPPTHTICSGEALTIGAAAVPGSTYRWSPTTGLSSPTGASTRVVLLNPSSTLLTQVYTLTETNASGTCETSRTTTISVNPAVDVSAGSNQVITEGEQVTLAGTANGTFPVAWSPAVALSSATALRPVAAPLTTTRYVLAARVGDCADTSSVLVTVTRRVRIPNALSPNGDGQDDTWEIDNIDEYPANHVVIFNRWGNKLFETTGYRRGNEWNGTIGGQPAPVGTYYYTLTLGNGKTFSGPLTVVY